MERLTREQVIEKLNKGDKNFSHLDLSGLDLSEVDLSNTNLSSTDLSSTDLSEADLFKADLTNANLSGADLSYADLSRVDLSNAKLDKKEKIRKGIILKEPMIGYKKCRFDTIVTLEIPKGAIVFSINNKKCRTNKAKVIEISNGENIAYSDFDYSFAYKLGKKIEIEDFDLRYNAENSTGIHFFRTREEAENFNKIK